MLDNLIVSCYNSHHEKINKISGIIMAYEYKIDMVFA